MSLSLTRTGEKYMTALLLSSSPKVFAKKLADSTFVPCRNNGVIEWDSHLARNYVFPQSIVLTHS